MAKYENRGFQLTQRDWWQVMEGPSNWSMDYFGDVTALGASFKNSVTDPYPDFPLVNTRRGWWVTRPFPTRKARFPISSAWFTLTQL